MIRFATAFVLALATCSAALAQDAPSLSFTIKGSNVGGGGAYEGTARIERQGDGVVKVEEVIAGKTWTGYGIANASFTSMAISLTDPSGGNALLLLEIGSGDTARGFWTTPNASSTGTEDWTVAK